MLFFNLALHSITDLDQYTVTQFHQARPTTQSHSFTKLDLHTVTQIH